MTKILALPIRYCIIPIDIRSIFILLLTFTLFSNLVYSQDDCDNDTIPPFFTYVAGDAIRECNLPTPVILSKAQDDCTEFVAIDQEIDTVFAGCPQSYILYITHIATDASGNSATAQQVVQIIDSNPPLMWGIPNDTTVFCSSIPLPAEPETWDNCGEVTVTLTETFIDEPGCWSFLVRDWVAADECGNITTGSQTLTVYDDLAPVLVDPPADMTVECDSIPVAEINATDACSTYLTYELTETVEDGDCPNESFITRTWIVSDDCNNSVSHTYTITAVDTTPPVFIDLVSELTIECPATPEFEEPTLSDNCGTNIQLSYTDTTVLGECPVLSSVTRTWTAVDECGNSSSASQTIHVVDTSPPLFVDPPTSLIVYCVEDIPPVPDIEYFDECSDIDQVIFKENPLTDFCGEGLRRTWAVFDACGNMAIHTQDIEVNDMIAPTVVSTPADTTISCGEDLPPEMPVFDDNCINELMVMVEIDSMGSGCPDPLIITRTWTAFDICNNTASHTQTIIVLDDQAPEFEGDLEDLVIDCTMDPVFPEVNAIDNCSSIAEFFFTDTIFDGDCNGEYSIVRIYTAIDACGNEASMLQTIDVMDNSTPYFSDTPFNITAECDSVPLPPELTALDDCDTNVTVVFEEFGWDGSCEGTLFRQWTATDDCSNEFTLLQEITIEDNTPPFFLDPLPGDMDVNCDSIPPASADDLMALDNCGEVVVTFEEDAEPEDCENGYAITRTWTATDECGNTVSHTQVLNAQNIQEPGEELTENTNAELSEVYSQEIVKIPDVFTNELENGIPPDLKIEINPNPTIDNAMFSILSKQIENVIIEIYDVNGVKVSNVYAGILQKDETYQFEFKGETMAPGIYIYRVRSENEIITDKIILTK